MGARRIRRDQRRADMAASRRRNQPLKTAERQRRQTRIIALIKQQGKLPYTPPVMSWLSTQLGKPSRQITQADVDKLLAAQ